MKRVKHVDDRVAVGGRVQQTGNVWAVRKQPRHGVLVERLVDKEARGEAPLKAGGGGQGDRMECSGRMGSRHNQVKKINVEKPIFAKNSRVFDTLDPKYVLFCVKRMITTVMRYYRYYNTD